MLWKKVCDYPADGDQKHSVPDCFERAEVSDLVEALAGHAAARRFLALTETGQVEWRCELTRVTETGEVKGVLPGSQTWQECFERRIHQKSYSCGWAVVIPADYLTEEET